MDLGSGPEKFAKLVGLPVLGAVLHHLWSRYRARLIPLRWTVQYQALALTTDDTGWGKIEILYDGQPTRNLHLATVQLQNASSRDLANVRIDAAVDAGSSILRSSGQLRGSLQYFPFAPEYGGILDEAMKRQLTPAEIAFWSKRSDFVIPVLNRAVVADFRFLIVRGDYALPQLTLGCEHVGVRLTHQPLAAETWGVRQQQAQLVGLIATGGIAAGAAWFHIAPWGIAAVSWAVGLCAILIGAVLVRGWRAFLGLAG